MRFLCLLSAAVTAALVAAAPAIAQTVQLPSPAASSLDRVIPTQYGAPISPPPPAWDPYAPQAAQVFPTPAANPTPSWAPSAIGGQPGYPTYPTAGGSSMPQIAPDMGTSGNALSQNPTLQQTMRLYQGARGSWAYLFGNNSGTQLGINELDTSATFALPFFFNSPANLNKAPLLITPGFGLQLWNGPNMVTTGDDLPPSTYDVFLDTSWNPQMTPLFGAELGIRVGIFTAWDTFVWDSWRLMGRAIGTINLTPTMQGKVGIVYLDRNQVKLLPAVGMTWIPDPNSRYDIFFPAPKAAKRFSQWRNKSIWGFLAGEYGGGAWTFTQANMNGAVTEYDYNDVRITGGVEMVPVTAQGLAGSFEVGYVFARNLYYVDGARNLNLNDTLMLRLGLAY